MKWRALWACLIALAAICASETARANGRFPGANQIELDDLDEHFVLARTTYGLVASFDDGATWQWICEAALGIAGEEDPSVVVMPAGAWLVAPLAGVERSGDSGCTWSPPASLYRMTIVDLVRAPASDQRVYAIRSDFGQPNGVFMSDDAGATWTPLGPRIEEVDFKTIEIAASDPMRIYLSGQILPTPDHPASEIVVHRSTDGGATFEPLSFTAEAGDFALFVSAVDPTNPDRVFGRVRNDTADRLVVSDDGGATWHETFRTFQMLGFALSPDGARAWLGSPEGLWRSTDRGETFERIADLAVQCLAAREGELWVCATTAHDGWELGRSLDDGDTFAPVMDFSRLVGTLECASGSTTAVACEGMFPSLVERFDAGVAVADGGAATDSAVVPPDAARRDVDAGSRGGDDGGCGCVAASAAWRAQSRVHAAALALVIALMLVRRRRRR